MTQLGGSSVGELWAALAENDEAPYGRVRTARAERLVELAEASGDVEVLIEALQDLVGCYLYGGEAVRVPVPFARTLAMWDSRPGDFSSKARYGLFWQFKWVAGQLLSHPDVPLAQIRGWIDQMQSRYAEAGFSRRPVLQARQLLADHLGDDETSWAAFEDWRAAPRDEMADCFACECRETGQRLVLAGRDADSIEAWQPVLDGVQSCLEEPLFTRSEALAPLVRLGQHERARSLHLAGYRSARGDVAQRSAVERHFEFAVRTGNEARALEILADHVDWLSDPADSPLDRATWLARVVRLMRRLEEVGRADLPVPGPRSEPGPLTASQWRARLEAEVAEVAARFDARNGNAAVSERLAARMSAPPLAEHLVLGLRGTTLTVGPPPQPVPEQETARRRFSLLRRPAAPVDAAALFERAVKLWKKDGAEAEALEVAVRAAHLADGDDDLLAAQARLLAGQACGFLDRSGEAVALLEQAVPELDRSGTDVEQMLVRRFLAQSLAVEEDHASAARLLTEALRLVEGWEDAAPQADLAHALAEELSLCGKTDQAALVYARAAELWRGLGQPDAVVRATRGQAWALVGHDEPVADPDWDAAIALFERAEADCVALATSSRRVPEWVGVETAETLRQHAVLLARRLDWDESAPDGTAQRAIGLAERAAAAFTAAGGQEAALLTGLLAAEVERNFLDEPERAAERVRGVRARAADLDLAGIVEACDDFED